MELPTVLFFRAAALVRAKRSAPSHLEYEYKSQHWSICEYAYFTRTSTPPGMLTIHHSKRSTRIYILLWLLRDVIAKRNCRLRHSLSLRPLMSKELGFHRTDFRQNGLLCFVLKFEDGSKFLLKSDNNNNNNRHSTCSITYTWLLWLETSPQLPWLPILRYLPELPTFLGLRGYAKAQKSSILWTFSNLFTRAL
jgi:hypothetical protein